MGFARRSALTLATWVSLERFSCSSTVDIRVFYHGVRTVQVVPLRLQHFTHHVGEPLAAARKRRRVEVAGAAARCCAGYMASMSISVKSSFASASILP